MDTQLVEIAQSCLSAAFDGTRDFSTIVRTLLAAGFEGYDIDYRRGTFTYFLPSGASAQLAMPKTEGSVAAEFKAADVERAVREAQSKARGCTYSGFCAKVKAAGCAGASVPAEGIAAGCHPQVTTVAAAFPTAKDVKMEAGSAVNPDLNGGPLTDGTYFLVRRVFRATGTMDSIEAAVLVIGGAQVQYFDAVFNSWAASVASESASSGPVVLDDGYLDTSGMVPCWGTGQLDEFVSYAATPTQITLRRGAVDLTFEKQ